MIRHRMGTLVNCSFSLWRFISSWFIQFKSSVRTQTDRHTYTCVLQCSPASVGLAQACPENTLADAQVTIKWFFPSFLLHVGYTIKHAVFFCGVIDSRWTIRSVVAKNEAILTYPPLNFDITARRRNYIVNFAYVSFIFPFSHAVNQARVAQASCMGDRDTINKWYMQKFLAPA